MNDASPPLRSSVSVKGPVYTPSCHAPGATDESDERRAYCRRCVAYIFHCHKQKAFSFEGQLWTPVRAGRPLWNTSPIENVNVLEVLGGKGMPPSFTIIFFKSRPQFAYIVSRAGSGAT
jgi:hypothetical protein